MICRLVIVALLLFLRDDTSALELTRSIQRRETRLLLVATSSTPSSEPWINSLITRGVSIKGVGISTLPGGLRGIVATEAIGANMVTVTVPAELAIETNNNRPPSPFPLFCSENFWSKQSKWDHRLAFKLLYEVKGFETDEKKKTLRKEWIQQLPSSFSTPFHWQDGELASTEYPALVQKVQKQRANWLQFYQQWVDDSGDSTNKLVAAVTFDDFVWALECVNSRAFSGVYEGSSAAERRSLFLFTGLLTLIWPLLELGSAEQSIAAAFAVGISIVTKDFFFSQAAGLKRYVICPFIDMFNHKSSCSSDVSYGYFSDSFELKTEGYKKGEQVFISYGKQSNDRLLQYYGFVDENNAFDVYDFGMGFVDLIIRCADSISVKVPQIPSPKDRLEQIADSITQTNVQALSSSNAAQKGIGSAATTPSMVSGGDDFFTRYFRTPPAAVQGKSSSTGTLTNNFDDITVRAMRALYSSPDEWNSIIGDTGRLSSLDTLGIPLSATTEQTIAIALRDIVRMELSQKSTSLQEDLKMKADMCNGPLSTSPKGFGEKRSKVPVHSDNMATNPSGLYSYNDFAALSFRVEKKTLLQHALDGVTIVN